MERSMLINNIYRGRKTNIWEEKIQMRTQKWYGMSEDTRWTSHITTWKPYDGKCSRGRPARWWRDEQEDYWKGTIWHRIVQDRQMWKEHAEAFAQPQDTTAAQWWWTVFLYCVDVSGLRWTRPPVLPLPCWLLGVAWNLCPNTSPPHWCILCVPCTSLPYKFNHHHNIISKSYNVEFYFNRIIVYTRKKQNSSH